MKPVLLMVALLFLLNAAGQVKDNPLLEFGTRKLEIQQEDQGTNQYLIVKEQSGGKQRKIKLHKALDPLSFVGFYKGDRNFAIIGGRYLFYLFNLNSNKIIGPIGVQPRTCAQDGQTGMLGAYKIIHGGQYLLVNATDYGVFCFTLKDIYHPEMLPWFKSDTVFFKGTYTFLDLRKDNIYNLIAASCGNYQSEIKSDILFQGYRLQQDSLHHAVSRRLSNKYLLFYQMENDTAASELIVDLETGALMNENETRELINRLLNR